MTVAIQNVLVTLVMLGAVGVVIRRVMGSKRASGGASCPSCESGQPCAPAARAPEPEVRPLRLVRPRRPAGH